MNSFSVLGWIKATTSPNLGEQPIFGETVIASPSFIKGDIL
jgi:hypothetical protein